MNYQEIVGGPPMNTGETAQGFANITQPQPDVSSIASAPKDAADLETRKEGWRKIAQNENFMRALGLAGASLMQPRAVGQTGLGQIGQAYTVGTSAYNLGEKAQQTQDAAKVEEARKGAESVAQIESQGAQTALNKARLPTVQAEGDLAKRTVQYKVDRFRLDKEKDELSLEKAKSTEEVDKIIRAHEKRKASILSEIKDETLRDSAIAEAEAAILKAKTVRVGLAKSVAETSLTATTAAQHALEAGKRNEELQQILKMDDKEKKEFFTKTGRYAGHTSGISQQGDWWGKIYDNLPDTDPGKKGKTREQFQMNQLKSAQAKDVGDFLTRYLAAGGDDADVIAGATDLVKQNIAHKKGQAMGTTPTTASGKILYKGKEISYDDVPKGEQYVAPDGKTRTKQ